MPNTIADNLQALDTARMGITDAIISKGGVKRVYIKETSDSNLHQYTFRGNTSITDVYFQWSQPSGTPPRYGLRAEATIHYDWDPDAV